MTGTVLASESGQSGDVWGTVVGYQEAYVLKLFPNSELAGSVWEEEVTTIIERAGNKQMLT